ncbi:MAG: hypothetical protein ACRDYY_12625 [Acidimicrobiales bacterium]
MKPVRFTRGSRKHRIGRASSRHVINNTTAIEDRFPPTGDTRFTWTGLDERGRELEIIAIDRPDCVLVIHVVPTHYRERKP